MKKQVTYPMEAFALAMIIFSRTMKEAMIVGICIVFANLMMYFIRDLFHLKEKLGAVMIGTVPALIAFGIMLSQTGMISITKDRFFDRENLFVIAAAVCIVIMLIKHHACDESAEIDYNEVLFCDAWAYGTYVLFAILRQYLTDGTLYTLKITQENVLFSGAYAKTAFGLIGAGIILAIFNAATRSRSGSTSALWVCIPAIALEVPFVLKNVPEVLGLVLGCVIVAAAYLVLRLKLKYSDTSSTTAGLPIEMILLGMVCMIATVL